ncbi:hypothetical protein MLD38_033650 [Melastoma candidum]|uniref:Uncharacterized protein n=1 Tax=Melastoma candidum TaxID=119954 RepID=A0ACB9M7K7_9MYRT|nr:hypothetical protein MLD38_033650 [Melastoma candidum]
MSSGDHPLPTNSNSSDLNLLMTRFRPIAPKPPIPGDPNLILLPDPNPKSTKGKSLAGVRRRRGRRGDSQCHASEGASYPLDHHETGISGLDAVRTLQLMITDPRAYESSGSVKAGGGEQPHPFWQPTSCSSSSSSSRSGLLVKRSLAEAEDEGTGLSHPPPCPVIPERPLHDPDNAAFPSFSSDPVVRGRVLDVCLIVESVSKDPSCIQVMEHLLGQTDEERLTGLAADDCPGFVSDVDKRVRWVNGAFERMMTAELFSRCGRGEVGVRMAASAEEDWSGEAFFTSRVRFQYTWREESCPVWWGPRVVTVAPCDALRMCSGGFAWRLDVKSALSLGR